MRRLSAREAHELMLREGYQYLDVRTEEEFAGAHPVGARNVPYARAGEHGLVPDPRFVEQTLALFGREAKLLVGCASGVRSLDAARALEHAGFAHVLEQRAGMDGVRDGFGRVRERGWRDEGLPIEYAAEQERS